MKKLQINQIKMPLEHKFEDVNLHILNLLRCKKENIANIIITKKSIDARKKDDIKIIYNVKIELIDDISDSVLKNKNVTEVSEKAYTFPRGESELDSRPIVIGSGPAGLFSALLLAENGYKPLLLERGVDVDTRLKDINNYFESGLLNEESNIQFGEGGAGTFSDGKLNTGVKDKFGRRNKILEEFVEAGAPEEILYLNKPHIGTDYLIKVVKNMRKKIESFGGEVRFNAKVTELIIENSAIKGVRVNDSEDILADQVVLALGHSARDTFKAISQTAINMEQKAFAIGLRIEHPQKLISMNQYGKNYDHENLPVADYKLTYRTKKGRGVYSFCMCPGGFVVNATSEKGRVVCNGMSNFKRDEINANSAILVNVTPEDFGSEEILAGVEYQRKWEDKAFELGGSDYSLPIQRFGDFSKNRNSNNFGDVKANTKGKVKLANLNECLPSYVSEAIVEGINAFSNKIKGFSDEDAILTGVETRSSSPIRILRDEELQSNVKGLYPCGEGAGYAGGIMSAAIDGIKVAEKVANK